MMKKVNLILLLLMTIGPVYAGELSGIVTPLASPAMEEAPCIEVPERSYDFGKLSLDRRYEHSFKVKNTGTGVLNIEKVVVG